MDYDEDRREDLGSQVVLDALFGGENLHILMYSDR